MTYYRKTGDTESPIEDTLTDETGATVSLAGATVAIHIWARSDGTTIVSDDTTGNVTITDAATGTVRYAFQTGDLASPGAYYYEWEVTFSDGGVETWPNHEPGATLFVTADGG